MDIIDFDYYADTYGGSLSEKEFLRALPKAQAYLRGATRGRTPMVNTNVCFVLCELCDIFAQECDRRGISSETCDGYSIHYYGRDSVSDEAWETVKIYLESSGLLYGGAV